MSDEAKDYGPEADFSPSERLAFQLKKLMRVLRTQRGGSKTGKKVFWKELAITVVLLAIWQAFSYWVPNPVIKAGMIDESLVLAPRRVFSIGALGIAPYLLAHWGIFWIVMIFSRLRRMEFRYRFSLNRYVLLLTFGLALFQGAGTLRWWEGLQSPDGTAVLPYFQSHPVLYWLVGLSGLMAGVAITLIFLYLVQRHGLPCPLTCMLVWTAFINGNSWRGLRRFVRSIRDASLYPGVRLFTLLAIFVVGVLLLWIVFRGIFLRYRDSRLKSYLRRLLSAEPPVYIFGRVSIYFLFTLITGMLSIATTIGYVLQGPKILGFFPKWTTRPIIVDPIILVLMVPSAFLVYRLIYNPALRFQMGERLGLEESGEGLKQKAVAALLAWCGFGAAIFILGEAKDFVLVRSGPYVDLFYFTLWDVLLVLFTVYFLQSLYRLRQDGLHAVVLTHGYYEPLFAAKALLEREGIRSHIWGEPFAMLYGLIVGPAAMKQLLVAEADRERAAALLAPALKSEELNDPT